jgi:hypothetical protein
MVSTAGADDVRDERGLLRLWASTDQGTHWREATVLPRHDGTFTAFVPGLPLRSGQTVSVRVRATAQEGRAIDQTIVDAYPVR